MFRYFRLPSSACMPRPCVPTMVRLLALPQPSWPFPPPSYRSAAIQTARSCRRLPTVCAVPRPKIRIEPASGAAAALEGTVSRRPFDRDDPRPPRSERDRWLIRPRRTQAGIDKVKLRPTFSAIQDPPAQQVELVREAVARNPLALILEPADPADASMAEVLQKAREDGIPVVLLNRPLAVRAKGSPRRDPMRQHGHFRDRGETRRDTPDIHRCEAPGPGRTPVVH